MAYRDQIIDRNRVLYETIREHTAEREYWLNLAWHQSRCGEDAAQATQQAAIHETTLRAVKRVAGEYRSRRTMRDVVAVAEEDAISLRIELERGRGRSVATRLGNVG
jgi:hypothetical protein